jgi:alkylated DNA repair dioxygenase AlkB
MESLIEQMQTLTTGPALDVKRNPKSTDVTIPGHVVYLMGPNLQTPTGAKHAVIADDSTEPRFAITLRWLGEKQPGSARKEKLAVVNINSTEGNWVGVVDYPNTKELLKSQLETLSSTGIYNYKPDITRVYGKTYENAGRRVMTIEINEDMNCTSPMKYKYGGKTVEGITTSMANLKRNQAEIARCFEFARETLGVEFNWCHCIYYPNGEAGLGAHQDNEKQIAPNSVIASFSVGATRKIRFMPK